MKRILRRPDVEAMTGLSRASIYKRMANGSFPRAYPLGGRIVGWLESEIQQWIDEHTGKSTDAPAGVSSGVSIGDRTGYPSDSKVVTLTSW